MSSSRWRSAARTRNRERFLSLDGRNAVEGLQDRERVRGYLVHSVAFLIYWKTSFFF